MKKFLTIAAVSLLLCGCMSPNPLIGGHALPSSTSGYIGGLFSGTVPAVGDGAHYAFVFVETSTGKEYTLPFFDPKERGYQSEKLRLIEVPAGRYRFSRWASYRTSNKEILADSKQAPGTLGEIHVSSSRVTFVGGYKVNDEYSSVHETRYVVKPFATRLAEVATRLNKEFPGFVLRE